MEYLPNDLDKITHRHSVGNEEFRLIQNRKLFFRVVSFNDNLVNIKRGYKKNNQIKR